MKKITAALLGLVLCLAMTARGQEAKPYKDGMVTQISYVKIKPGKFDAYMKFLDTTYKALMEAEQKAGLIVRYNVFAAQPRHPNEPDLILAVTFENMAALDKSEEEDAVLAKVLGSNDVQNKSEVDRESLREILGTEIIRELVLK